VPSEKSLTNSAGAVVSSGTYTSGNAIAFEGVEGTISWHARRR
jgi:hypothetical protein